MPGKGGACGMRAAQSIHARPNLAGVVDGEGYGIESFAARDGGVLCCGHGDGAALRSRAGGRATGVMG